MNLREQKTLKRNSLRFGVYYLLEIILYFNKLNFRSGIKNGATCHAAAKFLH